MTALYSLAVMVTGAGSCRRRGTGVDGDEPVVIGQIFQDIFEYFNMHV